MLSVFNQNKVRNVYILTVADYDGDNVRCRWASSGLGECDGVCQAFPGSFLNEVYT